MKPKKSNVKDYLFFGIAIYLLAMFATMHYCAIVAAQPDIDMLAALNMLSSHMLTQPFNVVFDFETLGTVTIVGVLGVLLMYSNDAKNKHDMAGKEAGSAHWNTDYNAFNKKYNTPFGKTANNGDDNMILSQNLRLSMNGSKTRLNNNILIIGGSGSGKSRFEVKPNLLQMNASFVVTDPKGELLETIGGALEKEGYVIKVFNTIQMQYSNHYNPFYYIVEDEDILVMVNTLSEGNVIPAILYVSSDGTSSTTPPTAAGTYTFKPIGSEDYEYTNNGTLIITPAPLTATVGDVLVKDNEKPEFVVSYSGFVNGETADAVVTGTPTYTVTKDGAEVSADENGYFPAGEYTVTASGLTATNYTITYKVGTLTVETSVVKPVLRSHSWSDTTDFMAYKSTITGITFLDEGTVPESPTHGPWDVSSAQNGSATAWMEGTEVYIVGNGTGTIGMPENSSAWFGSMSKLTAINGMDILDTSNVTNMDNLFDSCSSLTSVDLSGLDLGKVTQMRNMFAICTSLQSVDMHDLNTANLKLFSNVFNCCESLTGVNMSGMDTHNVTDINYMFGRCLALKHFDVGTLGLTNFDTSKVTNMSSLFYGCSNLETVDLTGFDTSSLENMSGMFNECSKLTSVVWGNNFDTSKTNNMGQLFANCSSLETVDVSKLNTSNATNISQMFMNDIKLKVVDLSGFDTANVQYMGGMFKDCNSLKELDLGNFNTAKVTDMYAMFANCNNLTSLNIVSFDTGNVVYMNQMFFGCTSLPELNVTSFDTGKANNMQEMFSNCIALTKLDLSSFDTAKVNNMQQMFYKDYNLKTIYASDKFVTTVAWSSKQMFDGCTAIVGGNGTVYDSKNIGSGYAHIDTVDNPGYFTSITATNSADDETQTVAASADKMIDAALTPEPKPEETVEKTESETTDSPAENYAESAVESKSEEPTPEETVTE